MRLLCPAHGGELPAAWENEYGDELYYDGAFYSFRSADGKSAFKIWTPPDGARVRALLLFGNPGGGYSGDTRSKSAQADMLTFGARREIAVGGVTGFPGRETYAEHGKYILRGLESMGRYGAHPELTAIPMIFSGGSNAGAFAYSMACLVPERTIAITPNVGGYFSTNSTPEVQKVPMWIHIGTLDALSFTGVESTEELFAKASREHVPHWIWDAELKGHENGAADHVDFAFWDAMLDARLPHQPSADAHVRLTELDFETGWVADLRSWDHRIVRILPAAELPADPEPGRYGWIASEGLARLYQAAATRSRPILLSLEQPSPEEAEAGRSGVFLSAGLSTIVEPGQEIVLKLDMVPVSRKPAIIEIWDRGEKLGEVNYAAGERRFAFTVNGDQRLYALYAHAIMQDNETVSERISAPLQLIVNDPALSSRVAGQLGENDFLSISRRSARAPVAPDLTRSPLPPDRSISSIRLNESEPAPAQDGLLAEAWNRTPVPVVMDQAHALRGGIVNARIAIRSRWSSAGLYFLFEVEDDSWADPASELFDTLDMHIATVDPARLDVGPSLDRKLYIMPEAYSLLVGQTQMQIPLGGPNAAQQLFVNYWNPWDPKRVELTARDHFGNSGIWIDLIHLGESRRALELFLPWAFVGLPGSSEAPPADTRLSFTLLYHDDASTDAMAWPAGINPWSAPPSMLEMPAAGQILLTTVE